MATFDAPDFWSAAEERLFDDAMSGIESVDADLAQSMAQDDWLQFLHHEAMWDFELRPDYRADAYAAFEDYIRDTYGLEWDDYYDWEDYREAYDQATA